MISTGCLGRSTRGREQGCQPGSVPAVRPLGRTARFPEAGRGETPDSEPRLPASTRVSHGEAFRALTSLEIGEQKPDGRGAAHIGALPHPCRSPTPCLDFPKSALPTRSVEERRAAGRDPDGPLLPGGLCPCFLIRTGPLLTSLSTRGSREGPYTGSSKGVTPCTPPLGLQQSLTSARETLLPASLPPWPGWVSVPPRAPVPGPSLSPLTPAGFRRPPPTGQPGDCTRGLAQACLKG